MQMTFQAVLEAVSNTLGVVVWVPFDPVKVWPDGTKLRVRGSIGSAQDLSKKTEIATSLIRSRERGYFLLVTHKMRKAAGISVGTVAEITLEPDLDGRAAEPPTELARLLKTDRSVKRWFEKLSYSMRKYIADAVAEPKSAAARVRRAETWMERMMLTMEGEELPPPILQAAFRRQPAAKAAWEAMTANQRKLKLLSMFSYQSPEARLNCVERIVLEATEAMRKGKKAPKSKPEK